MSLSHEDLLLLILSDQRWHSLHEILRRHPMMVHSRAAGLREKGYVIEHRCVGKGAAGSEYRLGSLIRRPESALSEAGEEGGPKGKSRTPASLSALTGEGGVNESSPARRSADVASVERSTSTSPPAVSAFESDGKLLSSGEPAVDSPDASSLPLSGLAETRAGAGGRPCSPAEPFLPMGRTPQTASPLNGRPLSRPSESSSDQEPYTAGRPGADVTGKQTSMVTHSDGRLSGPPCRDAGGCDSWGASLAPLAAAPDTVRLESLPVPGQLSLEDAA